MIPHEDKDARAEKSGGEASVGNDLPLALHDDEVGDGVGDYLRYSNNEAIDEDAHFEFVEHQSGGVELEDDRALEENEHQRHSSQGFESK